MGFWYIVLIPCIVMNSIRLYFQNPLLLHTVVIKCLITKYIHTHYHESSGIQRFFYLGYLPTNVMRAIKIFIIRRILLV